MLILGFVFGVGLVAFLFWYGSQPNERPTCGCGHAVREHGPEGEWLPRCRALDPSGLPCRCHYTRAQAAAAAKE
jgi:hypothetical protein